MGVARWRAGIVRRMKTVIKNGTIKRYMAIFDAMGNELVKSPRGDLIHAPRQKSPIPKSNEHETPSMMTMDDLVRRQGSLSRLFSFPLQPDISGSDNGSQMHPLDSEMLATLYFLRMIVLTLVTYMILSNMFKHVYRFIVGAHNTVRTQPQKTRQSSTKANDIYTVALTPSVAKPVSVKQPLSQNVPSVSRVVPSPELSVRAH